ncbi:MAG: glycosyl transferase [Alphaproteobacteria bacterium]|nr:glycosyl transferase [Alphaproteobacteria bacterium]
MSDAPRLLFWVQHLLGIGHLKRTATLARALAAGGFDVTVVSGGQAVPGLDVGRAALVQLAPVRAADQSFKRLIGDDDVEIDDAWRDARRDALLGVLRRVRPDIVLTELFPFGRRQLRFELLPLLEEAAPRAAIACSVRDILVEPDKPGRAVEMLALARDWYDLVLVHGDPALIPFDRTFPLAGGIAARIRYTGYVVDPPPPNAGAAGKGEVVVSAGGGAISEPLLRAAMAARAMTRLGGATWRLLAGPALAEAAFESLRRDAPDGVIVERARPDFAALLANCALSISQGGYNTVMDVLAAGCRAVICPYAGGHETEQTLRAKLLAAKGALHLVPEDALSSKALARAVEAALDGPGASAAGLDFGGAEASLRALKALLAETERTPA